MWLSLSYPILCHCLIVFQLNKHWTYLILYSHSIFVITKQVMMSCLIYTPPLTCSTESIVMSLLVKCLSCIRQFLSLVSLISCSNPLSLVISLTY